MSRGVSSFSFQHVTECTLHRHCTLTSFLVCCLFHVYPQTDTAQLYNTQSDLCWHVTWLQTKYWKTTKIGRISYAAWSGITCGESIERSSTKITRIVGWDLKTQYFPTILTHQAVMTEPTFLHKLLLLRVQESLAAMLECCEIQERIRVYSTRLNYIQASSSAPKVKRMDWREKIKQSEGQSCDWSQKSPYVVVTSLETDAFVAIVAYIDMLMLSENPTRGRDKKVLKEQLLFWGGKKSPRLRISKLRSNEVYSPESWQTRLNASAGHTMKFLGCTWYETKIREGKRAIWRHYPKRRTSWAKSLRARFWGANTWWNLTRSRLWQQSSLEFGEKKCTMLWKFKQTWTHKVLFMIAICSWQCDYSMKRQRFYCFIYFAQNTDIHTNRKNGETARLTPNGKTITCTMNNFVPLVVPGLSSIPAAVCLQHRDQRISKIIPENWDYYQIQSRLEVTSMHAGNRYGTEACLGETVNQLTKNSSDEMYNEDPTQGILDWLQPFTVDLEDLEMHVLAHSSEREISDSEGDASKVATHNGSTVIILTSAKTERDLFHEQKRLVTWK